MKPSTVIGFLLIVVGVIALLAGGFSYKKNDKVLDVGPVQATVEHTKTFPVPPLVGGLILVAGVAVLLLGGRSKA